jgi:adenylate cyclase
VRNIQPASMPTRSRPTASLPRPTTHHAFLAAASAQLGNRTAAGAHAREVLQREPAFTAQAFVGTLHYRNPTDGEHVREGLMKAGLPD